MTPETLADLHALSFDTTPRPWTADEFRELLAAPGVRLLTKERTFAVIRHAGPEVELLTLAVPPEERRRGQATALMGDILRHAADMGAEEVLLEVAETNRAARALYDRHGFRPAGHRKDYYAAGQGTRISALVLRKTVRG